MTSRYISTIIAAVFTCIMGLFYLVALHIDGVPDDTFRQAFIAGITVTTGSMAVERVTNAVQSKDGKNGNETTKNNSGSTGTGT